jgi:hypothetical protein
MWMAWLIPLGPGARRGCDADSVLADCRSRPRWDMDRRPRFERAAIDIRPYPLDGGSDTGSPRLGERLID